MILCLINVLILNIFDTSSTIPCRTIETVSFHEVGRMLSAPLKGKICDYFTFLKIFLREIYKFLQQQQLLPREPPRPEP